MGKNEKRGSKTRKDKHGKRDVKACKGKHDAKACKGKHDAKACKCKHDAKAGKGKKACTCKQDKHGAKAGKGKRKKHQAKAGKGKRKKHQVNAVAGGPSSALLGELLRAPEGAVHLSDFDPAGTPGFPGEGKDDAPSLTAALTPVLSDLQERLYADGRSDATQASRILVVLQGMDTSGKGGVIRHAFGLVDPQGIALRAFKQPTQEELQHDFLWRIRNALPGPGMIGIFDRSHYEDVLVVRVNGDVSPEECEARYDQINAFEAELAASGVTIIKCMLHVSRDEQKKRLAARLDSEAKYWKYNPGDIDVRLKWDAYQEAYELALTRCNTSVAPWHVIPSDHKWYRNWAVATLLREKLESLDLRWPAATFDVAHEKERVAAS